MTRFNIVISNSDGTELHFLDKELYEEYKKEEKELLIKYYLKIRERYGVWAGNQGKFVDSADQLNDWDEDTMEKLILENAKTNGGY